MGGYWSYPEVPDADEKSLRLKNELMIEIKDTLTTPVELRVFSGSPSKCGVPLGKVKPDAVVPHQPIPPLPGKTKPMWIQVKRRKKKNVFEMP